MPYRDIGRERRNGGFFESEALPRQYGFPPYPLLKVSKVRACTVGALTLPIVLSWGLAGNDEGGASKEKGGS